MINVLKTSPRDTKVYYSADSAITQDDTSDSIPVEVLNEINVSGLPVSKLTLKAGCPVILLCNLSTHDGLCNITRGILAVLKEHVVGIKAMQNGVMVQPPFPFSAHPWLPLTPSASTLCHLPPLHSNSEAYLCNLCKLCHAHSQTNCGSIPDPFGPGSHAKGHCLYTLSTFVLCICLILFH